MRTDKASIVRSMVFAVGIPCLQAGEDVNDPCVDCEIVGLHEQYREAARTIARVRDRLRVLGAPMPGFTSGGRRADQD